MKTKNTLKDNSFDIKKLYEYIKKFSFPRLAGTDGEKKAVNLTIKEFKDRLDKSIHK